jgi:ABC-type enterochelin transport system ATPase subunit
MPKEKKRLTVKELKEITPLVDVYELSPYRKYIVAIKKPSIIGMDQGQSMMIAREVAKIMMAMKIPVQIIANIDFNDVKFFEVS